MQSPPVEMTGLVLLDICVRNWNIFTALLLVIHILNQRFGMIQRMSLIKRKYIAIWMQSLPLMFKTSIETPVLHHQLFDALT